MIPSAQEGSTTKSAGTGLLDYTQVQLVTSLQEFLQVEIEYQRLAECADGFMFPSFRAEWIKVLQPIYFPTPHHTPFFVLVRRNGELIGAAMFRKVVRGMTPLAFRWLEFLGQHTGHSALDNLTGDFIVSSDADRELVIDAVCRALNGPLRALWDGISLKRFCAYSTSLSAFLKAFPQARAVQEEMSGFVAELGASFEDTWGQFDSKARKNLRRAIRLLDASGLPYHFETRDEIDASLLGEISVLHSGRQRLLKELGRNDRDDLLSGEVMLNRVGELLRAMARAGKLRIHLMRIDNALAAFSIVFGGRAGANSWLVAFDEAFSRFSPSRLMFEHMYRQEIERYGTPRVNLMLGYTQAKQDFSNRIYSSHTVEVLNVSSFSARLKTESLRIFRRVMR